MTIRDEFRQALGLDSEFAEAQQRWQQLSPRVHREPLPRSPEIEELSKRLQQELLDAQDKSDADFEAARARLGILSPWYAPPTDTEIQETRKTVKDVLYAIRNALKMLERAEAVGSAWYLDPGDVPGIERGLLDHFGPGNEQRGDHDPIPVLLVCRDLLDRYIETLDAPRATLGMTKAARDRLVHYIASTLFGGGVKTKQILAVLKTKGITGVTRGALDNIAHRLNKAGAVLPKRGGAPRGPRRSRTRSQR